jgi:hypothetical protein
VIIIRMFAPTVISRIVRMVVRPMVVGVAQTPAAPLVTPLVIAIAVASVVVPLARVVTPARIVAVEHVALQ